MASKPVLPTQNPLTFNSFANLEGEFCNQEMVVRLIHFWEARRNSRAGNILMGVELLLLDSESIALQGFVPASRLHSFQPDLIPNSLYKLKKFIVRPSKKFLTVSHHDYNIVFTDHTSFVPLPEGSHQIDKQKFRLRSYPDFLATVDTDTELFDVIGQLHLVSGDNLRFPATKTQPLEDQHTTSKDKVFLHLLMKDGETLRVYLWGDIATTFRARWNNSDPQPIVLLITTVNPRIIGDSLSLSSTSPTRLFFDNDIPETHAFMTRLGNGTLDVPILTTSSSAITKLETVSIEEVLQFIQNEKRQPAHFFVHATIVDVLGEHGWKYISCPSCDTNLGETSALLYCESCGKTNNVGILRYRLEISVCDTPNTIATFVLFDRDAAHILGTQADDLHTEANSVADPASVPKFIKNIIGRTFKFLLKVTSTNFTVVRPLFTVSRVMEDNIEEGMEVREAKRVRLE